MQRYLPSHIYQVVGWRAVGDGKGNRTARKIASEANAPTAWIMKKSTRLADVFAQKSVDHDLHGEHLRSRQRGDKRNALAQGRAVPVRWRKLHGDQR